MNTAIELLKTIGKDDIDINSKSLISSGELDSLDIMALVDAIEEKFNKSNRFTKNNRRKKGWKRISFWGSSFRKKTREY